MINIDNVWNRISILPTEIHYVSIILSVIINIRLPNFKIQNTALKKKKNECFECHNAKIFILFMQVPRIRV